MTVSFRLMSVKFSHNNRSYSTNLPSPSATAAWTISYPRKVGTYGVDLHMRCTTSFHDIPEQHAVETRRAEIIDRAIWGSTCPSPSWHSTKYITEGKTSWYLPSPEIRHSLIYAQQKMMIQYHAGDEYRSLEPLFTGWGKPHAPILRGRLK